jgi:hypothetical protein
MRKKLKGAGVILILVVLIFSTTIVYGQNVNSTSKDEATLTEISQHSSIIINNDPLLSRGPVLWDNGDPDGADGLSCVLFPSNSLDRYIIDDFYVPEGGWEIGGGQFRIVTFNSGEPDIIDNVLVYFFHIARSCAPEHNPYAVTDPPFIAELTGNYYFDRLELLVNCVFDPPVSLPMSGEWWVCFQPEMEDNSFWLTAATQNCSVYSDMADLGIPRWTWGYDQFGVEHDVSFVLTGVGDNHSIDVEKYVWDEKNQEWVDADSEDTALDVPICNEVRFKIVVHNNGEEPLVNIKINDKMHESLKFYSGDPEPDEVFYEEPFWYLDWDIPGPLPPDESFEIFVTAHVEGPECSYDFNYVLVEANGSGNIVRDEDYAWVHAHDKAREFNTPFLNFIQSYPNLFLILRKLLQQL